MLTGCIADEGSAGSPHSNRIQRFAMAYSHPSSRRFYDSLSGLQEEFERQSKGTSTKGSSARRFNIYLGNLKGEFELMSLEIETLREERDEYKEKVQIQVKLQDVRRNSVCERCTGEMSSARGIQKASSSFDRHRERYGPWQGIQVTPSQKTTTRRSTRRMTLIRKLRSIAIITPTQPSQSVSHAKHSETIVADFPTVVLPSPLPLASSSNVKGRDLVKFNNKRELDVEIAHTLYHGKTIWCAKFSRDGKYLAAGCFDGKAYVYNVQTGTLNCVLRNLLAEEDRVISVCFSHDGKYLATGTGDGGLFVWKIKTQYVRNAFKGHTHSIMSLDFSPNGRLLVSASVDNTVRLWNMRDGATKYLTGENHIFLDNRCYSSAVFSPDGRYVAASHYDGVMRVWSVHTGQLTRRMEADHSWANSVVFMSDGKGLVSGGWDKKLRYWDITPLHSTRFRRRPQTTRHRRASGEEHQTWPDKVLVGHKGIVYSIATSPDGRWIASGSSDQSVRIWDTRSAAMQCILKNDDYIRTVDFSPAGSYLASGGEDGILRVWKYSNVVSGDS